MSPQLTHALLRIRRVRLCNKLARQKALLVRAPLRLQPHILGDIDRLTHEIHKLTHQLDAFPTRRQHA